MFGDTYFRIFCLACDHTWINSQNDSCPKCGSEDFFVTDEVDDGWSDSHYEGDFPIKYSEDVYGE